MMTDREKVIKGLEVCRDMDNPPGYRFTSCDPDCPYHGNGCARKLKEDALALLKEQEAVEPIQFKDIIYPDGAYKCGNCTLRILDKDIDFYCPSCGRRVKWE